MEQKFNETIDLKNTNKNVYLFDYNNEENKNIDKF